MFGLSFWEMAVILVVALLALGPQRLPQALKAVARAMRELRRASSTLRDAIEEPLEEITRPVQEMRQEVAGVVRHLEREIDDDLRTAQQLAESASQQSADTSGAGVSSNADPAVSPAGPEKNASS